MAFAPAALTVETLPIHGRRVRPVPVLQWAAMRLRPLTEAECYARCYGGRSEESAALVWQPSDAEGISGAGVRSLRETPGVGAATERSEPREAA
jgi:hypothetical protein